MVFPNESGSTRGFVDPSGNIRWAGPNRWRSKPARGKLSRVLHQPSGTTLDVNAAAGPHGALWFTENGTNKIGRITTGRTITQLASPRQTVQGRDLVQGRRVRVMTHQGRCLRLSAWR